MRHVVAHVRFSSDVDGIVECSCGAQTSVADYAEHRRTAGEPQTGTRTLGPAAAPHPITVSRLRGTERSRE